VIQFVIKNYIVINVMIKQAAENVQKKNVTLVALRLAYPASYL